MLIYSGIDMHISVDHSLMALRTEIRATQTPLRW